MNNENENPHPDPTPAPDPVDRPTPPAFPPDRIEIHSDPGPNRPSTQPNPDTEKRER